RAMAGSVRVHRERRYSDSPGIGASPRTSLETVATDSPALRAVSRQDASPRANSNVPSGVVRTTPNDNRSHEQSEAQVPRLRRKSAHPSVPRRGARNPMKREPDWHPWDDQDLP